MSVKLPNGALIAIASGYDTAITTTAVSNANPAVITAANVFSAGDLVEVTSGWSRLNNRIVRVATPTAADFDAEGIDTTDTTLYPAGGGTGSIRRISGWTTLQQVTQATAQGGDQQFLDYQFLEDDHQTRIPTVKNAAGLDLMIADDPSLAGYLLAKTANDDGNPRAIQITLKDGSLLYFDAYVSLNETPTLTNNQLMALKVTLSFLNPSPTRY